MKNEGLFSFMENIYKCWSKVEEAVKLSWFYPVKTFVIRLFVNYLLCIINHRQETKFLRIIQALRFLAPQASQRQSLAEITGLIRNDHPSIRLVRRLIRESHPN